MTERRHLHVYRFDPGAVFEGNLLSAIERIQIGSGARIVDAIFLRREAETAALEAIDLGALGADATLASLLDFRLDPGRRRALSERTLSEPPGGLPRRLIEALAETLEEGAAILAVLQAGSAADVLEDAVARCGGRPLADEPVDARALARLAPQLRAAVGLSPQGG